MYETTTEERVHLIKNYQYEPEIIDLLEVESDKIRHGELVDMEIALQVITFQGYLKIVHKELKRWWQFWK